jgi:hypothetical protein
MKRLFFVAGYICIFGCSHLTHQPRETLRIPIKVTGRITQQEALNLAKRFVVEQNGWRADAMAVAVFPDTGSGWKFIFVEPTQPKPHGRRIEVDDAGNITRYALDGC